MATIIGGYSTDDVKRRLETLGKQHGYELREWLIPSADGVNLRVACTMRISGDLCGLAFKWDGDDLNELASRAMALDLSMQNLPKAVAGGMRASWPEVN